MRDFLTVFRFEFFTKMKQKSVRVTTLIMLLLVFAASFIPAAIQLFTKEDEKGSTSLAQVEQQEEEDMQDLWGYVDLQKVFSNSDIQEIYPFSIAQSFENEEALIQAVDQEEVAKGLIISSPNAVQLIVKDTGIYDFTQNMIEENINQYFFEKKLQAAGIDPQAVVKANEASFAVTTLNIGKNATTGMIFGMTGMLIVYFIVLIYGIGVATTVAREKNDRTMEILITNTKAQNLIWGKVVANVCLSVGQLLLMIIVGALGIFINRNYFPMDILGLITSSLNPTVLGVFISFALMGTFLYFFLYAALGALVSKVEEVNNATAPIQIIFVAAYMLCISAMQMPDSILMRVISIIPFSSPMAMFVRYTMVTVPVTDLLLAIGLMIVTIWIMATIAIRIYRLGTLNYGNRMSFSKAVKMAFNKEK
ncbi:MAG: ABC transporter permease [Clostridiales bacterium]|nr:ABC transporter permease [Clostridiales bacterium]